MEISEYSGRRLLTRVCLSILLCVSNIQTQNTMANESCDWSSLTDCCRCNEVLCSDMSQCSDGALRYYINRTVGCGDTNTSTTTTESTTNGTMTTVTRTTAVSNETDTNITITPVPPLSTSASQQISRVLCVSKCPTANDAKTCVICTIGCSSCYDFQNCASCTSDLILDDSKCVKDNTETDDEDDKNLGAIIGGSVGGVMLIIGAVIGVYCIIKRRKQRQPKKDFTQRLEALGKKEPIKNDVDEAQEDRAPDAIVDAEDVEAGHFPPIYENLPGVDRQITMKIQNKHDTVLRYTPDPCRDIERKIKKVIPDLESEIDPVYENRHMKVPQVRQGDDVVLESIAPAPPIPWIAKQQSKIDHYKAPGRTKAPMSTKSKPPAASAIEQDVYEVVGDGEGASDTENGKEDYENEDELKKSMKLLLSRTKAPKSTKSKPPPASAIDEDVYEVVGEGQDASDTENGKEDYENEDELKKLNKSMKLPKDTNASIVSTANPTDGSDADSDYENKDVVNTLNKSMKFKDSDDSIYENYVKQRTEK